MHPPSTPRRIGVSNIITLSLLFGVMALHVAGILSGWYTALFWFSSLLHFLGGMAAAAIVVWCCARYSQLGLGALRPTVLFFVVLSAVALIGVLWEFFEFALDAGFFGIPHILSQPSVADTMGDLALDLVGGTIFYILFRIVYFFRLQRL